MTFQCYDNKNTEFSTKKPIKQWVKAMNKVHAMTEADKMIFSYNQDGDTNGKPDGTWCLHEGSCSEAGCRVHTEGY